MNRPSELVAQMFPNVKWGIPDKPVLIVDGVLYRKCHLDSVIQGEVAYGVGLGNKEFEIIGKFLNVKTLKLYQIKADSILPLTNIKGLITLALEWSTKITSLSYISGCAKLEALVISDMSKLPDLNGIQGLNNLRYLEINGGNTGVIKYSTLSHIGCLHTLKTLVLTNVIGADDSLGFIIGMKALKNLSITAIWPTKEYAILSAKAPHLSCPNLRAWVKLESPIGGKDVMVIGKGKPFLNSIKDADKIRKFEVDFEKLKQA